ncbi:hypothetical protein B0H13DRAFT_2061334 [Mycena leptocephala]|nr:hypothetical protein B0H13DRAFT_2061334 [Mycena leptocephala]
MNQQFSYCFPANSLRHTLTREIMSIRVHASLAQCSSFFTPFSRKNDTFRVRRRAYSTRSPLRINKHVLSSLRPENLISSDFLDLSGSRQVPVYFNPTQRPLMLHYDRSTVPIPFPRLACGYLYYHSPAAHLPLAGSLRLRINSDDAVGSDLLLKNGLPWQILLPQIVINKQYAGVLQQLLLEKLVTNATVEQCQSLFGHRSILTPNHLIFHLQQSFSLPMTQAELRLTIVGREKLGTFIKQNLFGDPPPRYPFKGVILVRFELSPQQTRIFMRVVKIVVPVCCEPGYIGRVLEPIEGQLLSYRVRGKPTPWSVSLTESTLVADALRLLLDQ